MPRKILPIIAAVIAPHLVYAMASNPFNVGNWSGDRAPFRTDSFYVGAGVGSATLDYHVKVKDPGTIIDSKLYGSGVLGVLQGGYQANFGCYSLAIDAFANLNSQRTSTFNLYGPDGVSRNMQFINDWNAGVSLLPGYLLNDYLIAYLRLGYINSHYKVNANSSTFTNNQSGGQIGLGGEVWFPMLKNFSVRGEFDSILAPRWDSIGAFSCGSSSCNGDLDITNNVFQINFIYHII